MHINAIFIINIQKHSYDIILNQSYCYKNSSFCSKKKTLGVLNKHPSAHCCEYYKAKQVHVK
jgi:hypothetical protein